MLVGFPLGGVLSVAIAACAAVVLLPGQIEVTSLSQITMPVLEGPAAGWRWPRSPSSGSPLRHSGPPWRPPSHPGSRWPSSSAGRGANSVAPADAARFHVVMLTVVVACAAVLFTGVDPILVTEYSWCCSAIALPLTYLPILITWPTTPDYMGGDTSTVAPSTSQRRSTFVIILAASLAAIPLYDRDRSRPMSTSRNDFPDAPRPRGRLVDARLHLLDRQLFDSSDEGAHRHTSTTSTSTSP